ncbi:MAG: DsbA family protein [Gemmatimonadaceae bacterium]
MTLSLHSLTRAARLAEAALGLLVAAACGQGTGDANSGGAGSPAAMTPPSPAAGAPSPAGTPSPAGVSAPAQPAQEVPPPGSSATAERSPRRVVVDGVDLTGVGYDRGSATAPVVVVNFSDFGCPFCGTFARETEPAIEREYIRTGKVFFKYVPFVMGMFPNGEEAARASECAAEQGKFWPMHDQLYAKQTDWRRSVLPLPFFQQYAATLRLDADRFAACYASPQANPSTERANAAARSFGIRATPTFIINGRGLEGALPLPQFRQLLDDVLKGAQ